MKVLHAFKSFYPDTFGGVERLIDELCINTTPFGVRNTVYALSNSRKGLFDYKDEYDVHYAKCDFQLASTSFSYSAIREFRGIASQADILHYHFPNPFFDLLHFLSAVDRPYVVTYHSDVVKQKILSKFYTPLMNKFLKGADAIVATSENYVNSSKVLSSGLGPVSVIPIGITETECMSPSSAKVNYWRKKLPEKYFLYIGALRYYKGLDVAIHALVGTEMNLVILGSGQEQHKLMKLVNELNLNGRVIFVGAVSEADKFAILKSSYAFIFPSNIRSEAFGISLLEASIFGKAMISCDIGTGTSFVNIDNLTGYVVKPFSVTELRNAMNLLLESSEVTDRYGKNSRMRYESHFDGVNQAKSYFKLYEDVLK